MVRLVNLGRFKLFTTSVRVFNGIASHQVLEFDCRLGGTTSLLHDAKIQHLVGLSIQFDGHSILDIRCINGHIQRRVRQECRRVSNGRGAKSRSACEEADEERRSEHGEGMRAVWYQQDL